MRGMSSKNYPRNTDHKIQTAEQFHLIGQMKKIREKQHFIDVNHFGGDTKPNLEPLI
jgi:hypothetical protein